MLPTWIQFCVSTCSLAPSNISSWTPAVSETRETQVNRLCSARDALALGVRASGVCAWCPMPIEAEAFSPWLCLAAPHLSSDDPNSAFPRAAPYAVLQLFIDRAHALPAADLNGLSDPYVTAQINDQDLQVRRSCKACLQEFGAL